jgi:hypothetical protein
LISAAPIGGSMSICAVAMIRVRPMYCPMTSSSSTISCAEKRSVIAANVSSGAAGLDLLVAHADGAADRLVLDPLVLGAGRQRGDAQDRLLAHDRVDGCVAQQRQPIARPWHEDRLGVGDEATSSTGTDE